MHKKYNTSMQRYIPSENEPYMNEDQLEYFRQKLLDWREGLEYEWYVLQQQGSSSETAMYGYTTVGIDIPLEISIRDKYRKLINEIDQALERIELGTYGFCSVTGEPIGIKCLKAQPIATLSIEAQKGQDRLERIHNLEKFEMRA